MFPPVLGGIILNMFTCYSPILVFNEYQDRYISVPCGNCDNCQQRLRAEWDLRLYVESLHSVSSAFVTYTYEDDYLCVAHSYREFQLLHKRMRNDGMDFKFYHVSEFGETYGRPHNHELIFFKNDVDPLRLYDYAQYGIMDVGTVTPASIHYVTKWHVHPKYRVGESREQHGFTRQSKGLGSALLDQLTADNVRPSYKLPNGNILPVSRYYRKKIGLDLSDYIPDTVYDTIRKKHPSLSDSAIEDMITNLRNNQFNTQLTPRYDKLQ